MGVVQTGEPLASSRRMLAGMSRVKDRVVGSTDSPFSSDRKGSANKLYINLIVIIIFHHT
jgi:hypothetical protein